MSTNDSSGKETRESDQKCENFDVHVKKIKKSMNIFTKEKYAHGGGLK
jgi:hypothetical protein